MVGDCLVDRQRLKCLTYRDEPRLLRHTNLGIGREPHARAQLAHSDDRDRRRVGAIER